MKLKQVLLDTNIIVPLEDYRVVPEHYSTLVRKLNDENIAVMAHEASFDDISRDLDLVRREKSKSKLAKYTRISKSLRTNEQLQEAFGIIASPNDLADCHLLAAVADNAAHILVTEDSRLHSRAKKVGLADRVFRVRQLLDYILDQFAYQETTLAFVEHIFCYQLRKDDPIFLSLERDYAQFKSWWSEKCCATHRKCWVVRDKDAIAGLIVYKDEADNDSNISFAASKILKICTFKVAEQFRGGRLGEQLLRQAIWYAYVNNFEILYLTIFPKQLSLIDLLLYFGFQLHSSLPNDELAYAKKFSTTVNPENEYDWHRLNYPALKTPAASSAIVPIRAGYHARLFPEASLTRIDMTPDLFEGKWSSADKESNIPSTSIRKVYVCKSQTSTLSEGSRLYFYVTKNDTQNASQALTAIGILENITTASTTDDLLSLTAKRSVYRAAELQSMLESGGSVRILNFLITCYLEPVVGLYALLEGNILKQPPQSIVKLTKEQATNLERLLKPSFVV